VNLLSVVLELLLLQLITPWLLLPLLLLLLALFSGIHDCYHGVR
jgi:fatty acid desaturase